jgi:hypothetical protein
VLVYGRWATVLMLLSVGLLQMGDCTHVVECWSTADEATVLMLLSVGLRLMGDCTHVIECWSTADGRLYSCC